MEDAKKRKRLINPEARSFCQMILSSSTLWSLDSGSSFSPIMLFAASLWMDGWMDGGDVQLQRSRKCQMSRIPVRISRSSGGRWRGLVCWGTRVPELQWDHTEAHRGRTSTRNLHLGALACLISWLASKQLACYAVPQFSHDSAEKWSKGQQWNQGVVVSLVAAFAQTLSFANILFFTSPPTSRFTLDPA